MSSGQPLNITSGLDQALNGVASQRGQQLLADPYGEKSGRPLTNFLNPLAFTQPTLGTLGNVGRNSMPGRPLAVRRGAVARVRDT